MQRRAAEPHPEARAFLEEKSARAVPSYDQLSVTGARRLIEATYGSETTVESVGLVRNLLISGPDGDDLPLRVYVPEGTGPHPVLVWLHGGGFVLGGLESHDPTCRILTRETDAMVVSVDYRLAPEHPFPAALRDCHAAIDWVVRNAEALGGDPDLLAVGGQSSGGNLATASLLWHRETCSIDDVTCQVLVYPVADHAFDTPSYEENADGYHLTRDLMRWFWNHYLRDDLDGHNPYASVLRAPDLTDLPPTTVITAGFDPLRDEGFAFVDRLEASDVSVSHRHYEAMIHGFFAMHSDPCLVQGRDAIRGVATDLHTAWGNRS